MDPIIAYIEAGALPDDQVEASKLMREAAKYTVVVGMLYKRGFSAPLLRCLEPGQVDYVLREVHEGVCGTHIGDRALASKVVRTGYFWPTFQANSMALVKKCDKCQWNANLHQAPPEELSPIATPWLFYRWG